MNILKKKKSNINSCFAISFSLLLSLKQTYLVLFTGPSQTKNLLWSFVTHWYRSSLFLFPVPIRTGCQMSGTRVPCAFLSPAFLGCCLFTAQWVQVLAIGSYPPERGYLRKMNHHFRQSEWHTQEVKEKKWNKSCFILISLKF